MSDHSLPGSPIAIPFPNNETLMDYATYVLKGCKTPELTVPKEEFSRNLRANAPLGNSCVSPLVAARGWGLLAKLAGGKTSETVGQKTAKIVGCDVSQLHEVVNSPIVYNQGVVAFFSEFSRGSRFNEELVDEIRRLYGDMGLSKMCFSCDHDGMRSMSFINRKIEEATENRVHYVVREENAPHRRAVTALVSAVDCTFFWKNTGPSELLKANFYDLGRGAESWSVVNGWKATGTFAYSKDSRNTVLVLESYIAGFQLILFKSHNNESVSAKEVLEASKGLETQETTVFVPQFSVATPLCLRDCSLKGKYNMERVFDREKSDLSGYLSKFHPFSPSLTTLWDHYHKAVFTIINGETDRIGGEQRPARFEPQPYAVWNWSNDLPGQCCKYYEQRLPKPPGPSCLYLLDREEFPDAVADVAFDEPFYFLMVQNLLEHPLVHCFGRFTNADAVYSGKKKERRVTV